MLLRVCALSLWDGSCQGLLAAHTAGVSFDVVCIPSTQRSEAQFLCACVCPNHSNNSTGLQHQQQEQCSFALVLPSPGTAAAKPCSFCCSGQDFSHCSSSSVDTTLGNRIQLLLIILRTCRSLPFRTYWSNGQHRVRVFNAMLVLIFIPQ